MNTPKFLHGADLVVAQARIFLANPDAYHKSLLQNAIDQLDELPQARLRHHVTGAIERGEKQAIVEKPVVKNFTVVTVSSNANSFGYKSVLCLAEDGEGFEGLVQAYGTDKVPARGDVVLKTDPRWYAGVRELPAAKPDRAAKILKSIKG